MSELNLFERAKDKALYYLRFRNRTTAEMRRYLQRKGFPDEVVDQVIEWLRDRKYLDDNLFAELYIVDRVRTKPMGKIRLRHELRQKGVDSEIIENCLAQITAEQELSLARDLARRKLNYFSKKDNARHKMGTFLSRRGFSYEIIRQILDDSFLT